MATFSITTIDAPDPVGFSGYYSGVFYPENIKLVITNNFSTPLFWNATLNNNFIQIDGTNYGTVPGNSSVEITVSLTALARSLSPGNYTSRIIFFNSNLITDNVTQDFQINIYATQVIEVFPEIILLNKITGRTEPLERIFTVWNKSSTPMNVAFRKNTSSFNIIDVETSQVMTSNLEKTLDGLKQYLFTLSVDNERTNTAGVYVDTIIIDNKTITNSRSKTIEFQMSVQNPGVLSITPQEDISLTLSQSNKSVTYIAKNTGESSLTLSVSTNQTWATSNVTSVSLPPNLINSVPITITISNTLSPGNHTLLVSFNSSGVGSTIRTVNVTVPQPPPTLTINTGNTVTMAPGSLSRTPLVSPATSAVTWTQISGPSVSVNTTGQTLNVNLVSQGTYKFRATAICGNCLNATAFDDLTVIVSTIILSSVSISSNKPDLTVNLQNDNTIQLTGSAQPTGIPVNWTWSEDSGNPANILTLNQINQPAIILSFYIPGSYTFTLTGTNNNVILSASVTITVAGNPLLSINALGSFNTADNLYAVKYFTYNQSDSGLFEPEGIDLSDVLDLSFHTYKTGNGNVVATCAYPCVKTVKNNTLLNNNEQIIFVAYQAFVNSKWKIYLREICISQLEKTQPKYVSPYNVNVEDGSAGGGESGSVTRLSDVNIQLVYHPTSAYTIQDDGDYITRVVYEMTTEDGKLILETDENMYLRRAKTLISYDGNLLNYWMLDRNVFSFTGETPNLAGDNVITTPFGLIQQDVYGVHPVQRLGLFSKWIYFGSSGELQFDVNGYGAIGTKVSQPVLMAQSEGHCTRPRIFFNNNNELFLVYQDTESGIPQIKLTGTGDFQGDSVYGSAGTQFTRFFQSADFKFSHQVTSEYINQLPDIFIDDYNTTHICWQSSINGYWEIYYANSTNMFSPVRITKSKSRSMNPKISANEIGDIYITYHDNRFGPHEIMVARKKVNKARPFYQQENYITSLRSEYSHYIDVLHCNLYNDSDDDILVDVKLDFYKNRVFSGEIIESVSTSENTENFQLSDDSFSTDIGQGIVLPSKKYRELIFNVGDDVFNFVQNQVYFVKITYIHPNKTQTIVESTVSFSTSKSNQNEDNRWLSSRYDYSDTRVTNTSGDSLRPSSTILKNNTLFIVWEDYRYGSPYILGGLIDNRRTDILKSSGSQNWFDYSNNISGTHPDITNDLFGRSITVYTKSEPATDLPNSRLAYKICDFTTETIAPNQNEDVCIKPSFFSSEDTRDPQQVYKMLRVAKKDVSYYTINSQSKLVPIVTNLNIALEILGSPELVAFRIKNDGYTEYTDWINFQPEISDYFTVYDWTLSPGSGSKTVCVEMVTYAGKTIPITLNIIADLEQEKYDIRICKEDGSELPEYQSHKVVSVSDDNIKIKVDIITAKRLESPPTFDVVHQGVSTISGVTTEETLSSDNSTVYTGYFSIPKSDGRNYKDGIATIIPNFARNSTSGNVNTKDSFNFFTN